VKTVVAAASSITTNTGSIDIPIELATSTGVLVGSLYLPANRSAIDALPLVVLHAGSGAADRDGDSQGVLGKNDNLKMLAIALAENGIASPRYDKRGIAKSAAAVKAEITACALG
jgi:uncharacterized protein